MALKEEMILWKTFESAILHYSQLHKHYHPYFCVVRYNFLILMNYMKRSYLFQLKNCGYMIIHYCLLAFAFFPNLS